MLARTRPLLAVYLAVVAGFGGQQSLAPVLPPLARSLGLTEFQTGLFVTTSALLFMAISPLWGRAVTRWGAKPIVLMAMIGVACSLLGLAIVAQIALRGDLSPTQSFWALLAFRGVGIGFTASAIPVAAQASLVQQTSSELDRVRAMGAFGATFGLANVIGPALGGLLATWGLLVPLYVPPGLVVAAAFVVWRWMRPGERAPSRREGVVSAPLVPRVWRYLVTGGALFVALGAAPIVLAFLIQDRFELGPEEAAQQTGVALLGYGAASLLTQAVLVRRLGWPPSRLLRVGLPVTAVALVAMAFAPHLALIVVATALFGLGQGLAIPGYTAAPTLLVEPHEQGRLAGLLTSVNGAGSMAGPLIATTLYVIAPAVPLVACALLLAAVAVVAQLRAARVTVSGQTQRSP